MAFDLVQIRERAKEKEEENYRFRAFLKHNCTSDFDEIDRRVFEATHRVWAGIDCTHCAQCCRELKPGFTQEEVDRVAQRLKVTPQQFIVTYLERSDEPDAPWTTRTTPCPFLNGNLCSIYEDRPKDCSGYPYLYEPDFVLRTLGMVERTLTCPIVFEVMEQLKKSVGFPPQTKR